MNWIEILLWIVMAVLYGVTGFVKLSLRYVLKHPVQEDMANYFRVWKPDRVTGTFFCLTTFGLGGLLIFGGFLGLGIALMILGLMIYTNAELIMKIYQNYLNGRS